MITAAWHVDTKQCTMILFSSILSGMSSGNKIYYRSVPRSESPILQINYNGNTTTELMQMVQAADVLVDEKTMDDCGYAFTCLNQMEASRHGETSISNPDIETSASVVR